MQAVSNLLDNASRYTPDGGTVGLSVDLVDTDVVLSVSDSGLGIGLTVVRELVDAHGGTVVASSPGSGLGSRFVVTLPLHRAGPSSRTEL